MTRETRRLLVSTDSTTMRTIALTCSCSGAAFASAAGRDAIRRDSGGAADGASLTNRWHPSALDATKDIDSLSHSYQRAGYQALVDQTVATRNWPGDQTARLN